MYREAFSFMLCDFWTRWTQHHSQKRVLRGDHVLNLVTLDSNISDLPHKKTYMVTAVTGTWQIPLYLGSSPLPWRIRRTLSRVHSSARTKQSPEITIKQMLSKIDSVLHVWLSHNLTTSGWVGFNIPSTHYRSFRRRVFSGNRLRWYWPQRCSNICDAEQQAQP